MRLAMPRLYAIIDPSFGDGRSLIEICEALLAGGATLLQYRDKSSSPRALFENGLRLAVRVHDAHSKFILNDRADIARALEADGVHVGQDDLPVESARRVMGSERWVGFSTHDLDQVREADSSSADYVAFGPVFQTFSKQKPDPVVGLDGVRAARQATGKALVAIGGITVENACSVIEAGADSVAVIQNLLRAPDIAARTREFLAVLSPAEGGATNAV